MNRLHFLTRMFSPSLSIQFDLGAVNGKQLIDFKNSTLIEKPPQRTHSYLKVS